MGTQFDLLSLPPAPHYVSSDTICVAHNLTNKNESILNDLKETHVVKNENIDVDVDVDDDVELRIIIPMVISAILKQLSEKLDSVRDIAGKSLENILSSDSCFIPYVTDRESLEEGILQMKINKLNENKMEKSENQNQNQNQNQINNSIDQADISTLGVMIDWSQPGLVFPFLVNDIMSRKNSYFGIIFSGLLISVGGLSEALVKESSSSLLRLCTKWTEDGDVGGIVNLANCLLYNLNQNKFDDRVIIPLLKTTEFLLRSGVMGKSFLRPVFSSFYPELIELISVEQKRTNDVGKLRICVDLYLLLLQVEEPVRTVALKNMVLMLGHKVRALQYIILYYILVGHS